MNTPYMKAKFWRVGWIIKIWAGGKCFALQSANGRIYLSRRKPDGIRFIWYKAVGFTRRRKTDAL